MYYKGRSYTPKKFKEDIILNFKTKIRPILISFSGLPNSGKSTAVSHLLKNYVQKSISLPPMTNKDERTAKADGISYYEVVAAGFHPSREFTVTEVTKETSCAFGVLSAFSYLAEHETIIPLLDSTEEQCFEDLELNGHLQSVLKSLSDHIAALNQPESSNSFAKQLIETIPDGIALINIWDVAVNKTVYYFLTALQGHLYNSHMWLFLDLERDLQELDEPPELPRESTREVSKDGTALMKWRPRLHYLLRSCRMSEKINGNRRRVCTLFAKHSGTFNGGLQEKVEELEDKVQQTAKVIGVSSLLQEKIEVTNLVGDSGNNDYSRRLYHKFQQIICETPYEDIPLSWVFLRSLFYYSQRKFISKRELTEKAKQCGMNEESVKKFCKFYTSFGSIFDLSLVSSEYQYVIVKPMGFLSHLDVFLNPKDYMLQIHSTLNYGLISQTACKNAYGEDWSTFMEALICIDLAVKVSGTCLEEIPDHTVDSSEIYYYIPLSRTVAPLEKDSYDDNSVYLMTSVDSPKYPSAFKQVIFSKALISSGRTKLVPCHRVNETMFKDESTNTTITIAVYSSATKLHLDKPNSAICTHIIEAYHEATKVRQVGTTKFQFVKICSKIAAPSIQAQDLPCSQHHVLPDDTLCDNCDKENDVIKTWNTVIQK